MSKKKSTTKKSVHFSESEPSDNSGSDSSTPIDFLGIFPPKVHNSDSTDNESVEEEEEVATGDDDDSGGTDEPNNDDSGADNGASGDSTSESEQPEQPRHSKRKQSKPKRHKDRVAVEIRRLQKTTNFLIPRLPFQRYVFERKPKK